MIRHLLIANNTVLVIVENIEEVSVQKIEILTDLKKFEGYYGATEAAAKGLTHLLRFEVAPEDADRRFVLDQTDQVYVLGGNGLQDELFLDISDKLVNLGLPQTGGYDERGLLGLVSGIRHRGQLDRILDESDDLWIVPADVHF